VVVGGQNELAAFDPLSGRELWRARHTPPGRGILRTVAAVAARAASLYFRYGGVASTAFSGIQIARVAKQKATMASLESRKKKYGPVKVPIRPFHPREHAEVRKRERSINALRSCEPTLVASACKIGNLKFAPLSPEKLILACDSRYLYSAKRG